MSYDTWKTTPPALPNTDGRPPTMTLTCRNCPWAITARPIVAVSGAVRHTDETGHAVSYRGVVQEFARRQ